LIETNQLGRTGKSRSIKKSAKFDALFAARFSASALLKMFLHDPLTIWAVIVIVINLPVSGRFFDGIGVVRRDLRHHSFFLGEEGCERYFKPNSDRRQQSRDGA
jgi:hypothetical protein